MKPNKLLLVITFVCLLFTFKMCTNVENVKLDLILEEHDNLDLISDLSDIKHENYKLKKSNDSINKLYQKAIYVEPTIKKPYVKPITIVDTLIVPRIEIKDTI